MSIVHPRACDNPFRSERIDRLEYEFLEGSIEAVWARWRQMGNRGCIIGPEGSGKTALLDRLAAGLAERGYGVHRVQLRPDRGGGSPASVLPCPAGIESGDVILMDGADLLDARAWRRWERALRAPAGLIATSHRRAMLPVLFRCETTPELLFRLLGRLVDRSDEGLHSLAIELFHRHQGNLRAAFRECYDRHAGRIT
ncbi:MAG TPA: hypothetical protein P5555_04030 [Candidatus Paceibacterota bacterium]|nr:hypothetical protein [Verrucomicrobiota bacterium]HRZ44340.1 hypothetical protein [Candidatus Paceibacterota bacterium]HRZ93190.1 hypothetical protein [Candidatus Paceibacterota bacterium]